ncbi:hypothetical protein CPC08DRAFT_717602 [Agrocybe pediades]|nr:hypothetical protein CPC08DRAFT_717602 [Agrocybe pediades]
MSAGLPQVFVDDSDPSIVYSGQDAWAVQTGIPTAPQPFTLPAHAPFYGTIHQIQGNTTFSYVYNGTSISAFFFNGANVFSISNIMCWLDGKALVLSYVDYSATGSSVCSPGSPNVADGQHNLTLSFTQSSGTVPSGEKLPYFDGLLYTPSNQTYMNQEQKTDVAYSLEQALLAGMNFTSGKSSDLTTPDWFPATGFDFDFKGTSMAVYVSYSFSNSTVPLNLSYNIDYGPSINFTLDRPSSTDPISPPISSDYQLVLQTPQYAQGQHHLHVDLLGPAGNDPVLNFELFYVQNSPNTRNLALAPVPPVPSSATSTAQPTPFPTDKTSTIKSTSHHTIPRTIVAIAATLPAFLSIFILSVLYIKRRTLRRKLSSSWNAGNSSEVTVTPFIPSIFMRTVVESSKRMPDGVPYLARGVVNVSKANRLVPPSHTPTQAAALPGPVSTL